MENLDGTIEIKNAKVIVTDLKGDGRFARIKAGKEVEVYLDEEKITDESIVFSDSKIEIKKMNKQLKKI